MHFYQLLYVVHVSKYPWCDMKIMSQVILTCSCEKRSYCAIWCLISHRKDCRFLSVGTTYLLTFTGRLGGCIIIDVHVYTTTVRIYSVQWHLLSEHFSNRRKCFNWWGVLISCTQTNIWDCQTCPHMESTMYVFWLVGLNEMSHCNYSLTTKKGRSWCIICSYTTLKVAMTAHNTLTVWRGVSYSDLPS